jgi:glycosyltransferase involved in cell wall biosynthesis
VSEVREISQGCAASESPWVVAVVIPARDEAGSIAACLRSVLAAATSAGVLVEVTVVADRCTDATAAVARRVLRGAGQVIEVDVGSVGASRSTGSAAALDRLRVAGHRADRSWLLATDADSTVGLGWIAAHLTHADAGAQGVAGVIVVDSFVDHAPGIEGAFRRRYAIAVDGEHPHVHGTNLGVRADAYDAVGGWRALDTREDHDLWERLRAAGAVLVATVDEPVRTSGRAMGRAPHGFAGLLRSLGSEEVADGPVG